MPESLEPLSEDEANALHGWLRAFDIQRINEGSAFQPDPSYLHGLLPSETPEQERDNFAQAFHGVLRELVTEDGYVHFVDEQHVYARFYPHRRVALAFDDIVLDGETAGYVAQDRGWGLVSIGWTYPSPMAFFGEPLVSRLRERDPPLLKRLL
jgi:hypothetical protein